MTYSALRTACSALAIMGFVAPAHAAIVTRTYDFSASNFLQTATPPPVPVVRGSFTVTFDDAVPVTDVTSGLTINSLNIPVGSQIVYSYELGEFGFIRFGGTETGSGGLLLGTNDILFQFSERFGGVLFYSSALTPDSSFFTTNVDVRVTQAVVPEPASWAMMLIGFIGIGTIVRSTKRRSSVNTIAPA
jgi:hypothetical protein